MEWVEWVECCVSRRKFRSSFSPEARRSRPWAMLLRWRSRAWFGAGGWCGNGVERAGGESFWEICGEGVYEDGLDALRIVGGS